MKSENFGLSDMSDDFYVWSCPIRKIAKKITKCNVSPRVIESQFTVSTSRRSYAIKRTNSPDFRLSSKSNNFVKLETKRDYSTSLPLYVEKQGDSKKDLKKRSVDKNIVTSQKSGEIKNLKTVATKKFRSPSSKTSKSNIRKIAKRSNRSIQTERQSVLSHFASIGTAVVDYTAPWLPYVGATALAIVFIGKTTGYLSKKMEKALSIYNMANELISTMQFNDIPLMGNHVEETKSPKDEQTSSSTPEATGGGATVNPDTLSIHYNKLLAGPSISIAPPPGHVAPTPLRTRYSHLFEWDMISRSRTDFGQFGKSNGHR